MNEAIHEPDGTFVGFCYIHQGRRVVVEGEDGCQHQHCQDLRKLPDSKHPYFNVERLKQQNAIGKTVREMEREITDQAKADGRDIQRPTH